jgi:hypothetical protein
MSANSPIYSSLHNRPIDEESLQQEPSDRNEVTNSYSCRICLEEDCSRRDVIAPCACKGSSQWVHRACLDQWRSTREDKAFSKCTECLQYYQLVCLSNDTAQEKCVRRTRFAALVCKDFLGIFLLVQFFIITSASFIYLCDKSSSYLLNLFQMNHHPYLLYYLLGLFMTFSLTGMIGTCVRCQICGDCCNAANDSCYFCNDFVLFPYYFGPIDNPCLCCNDVACVECGSCQCGECGMAALGEEAVYLFLFLLVLFAIIGVFVFIIVGVMVIQSTIKRHIHILDKWNLTKEYLVKDLGPGALPVPETAGTVINREPRYDDLEANHSQSLELPVYSATAPVRAQMMNRDGEYHLIDEDEELRPLSPTNLPEPSAPPMEYLAPNQRDELIIRGLL